MKKRRLLLLGLSLFLASGIAMTSPGYFNTQPQIKYAIGETSVVSFATNAFDGQGVSGSGGNISATISNVTISCDKGYGTTQVRCYKGSTLTISLDDSISSTYIITKVEITVSSTYTGGLDSTYNYKVTDAKTSISYNLGSQLRFTKIDVTIYQASATTSPKVTITAPDKKEYGKVGSTYQFTVTSENIDTPVYTWNSSDTDVATISDTGLLTPVAYGTTTITATANGTVSNAIEFTIYPDDANILTVDEALDICAFTGTTQTKYAYTVNGKITSIPTAYSSQFNNISVNISNEDETKEILCFRMGGGSELAVGDYIDVLGYLVIYDGTPEFDTGSLYDITHHTVSFDTDGGTTIDSVKVAKGAAVGTIATPTKADDETYKYTFEGWYTDLDDESTKIADISTYVPTTSLTIYANYTATPLIDPADTISTLPTKAKLSYNYTKKYQVETYEDELTNTTTGVSGTSYTEWSGKSANSSAVYAGQSAGEKGTIQLRSKNSNSGIITTTSGGLAKKITVEWNSTTTSGRTIDIYGKTTAYSSASDLYNNSNQGTKIGSIVYGTSTELTISDSYSYIGLRSHDGALYLDSVTIEWDVESKVTYSFDEGININFGGIVEKNLYDSLEGATKFGVAVARTADLAGATIKDAVTNNNASVAKVESTVATPTVLTDETGKEDTGDYYIWNGKLNLAYDKEALSQSLSAVAYVSTSAGYVFFEPRITSVKDLVTEYLTNTTGLSATQIASLNALNTFLA